MGQRMRNCLTCGGWGNIGGIVAQGRLCPDCDGFGRVPVSFRADKDRREIDQSEQIATQITPNSEKSNGGN